jgi:hypothetical protein
MANLFELSLGEFVRHCSIRTKQVYLDWKPETLKMSMLRAQSKKESVTQLRSQSASFGSDGLLCPASAPQVVHQPFHWD